MEHKFINVGRISFIASDLERCNVLWPIPTILGENLLEGFPLPLSNCLVSSVGIGGAGGGYDQRIAVRTQMDHG